MSARCSSSRKFSSLLDELKSLDREQFYLDIQENEGDDEDPVTGIMGMLDDAVVLVIPSFSWLLG
jgi:hypothetical protein